MLKKINLLVISCLFNFAIQTSEPISIKDAFAAIDKPDGYEIVKNYIETNPDKINFFLDNFSILHQAAWCNKPKIVELLINNKADLNITNEYRNTPLHYAIIKNHIEVAILLINANANLEITNVNGQTPLSLAIKNNLADILALIEETKRWKDIRSAWIWCVYTASNTALD